MDLRIEFMEHQIEFYDRLNRDYDDEQRLLHSMADDIGGIRALLGAIRALLAWKM